MYICSMKECYKCKAPISNKQSYCKDCRREVDKAYNLRRDKTKKYANANIRKDLTRQWLKNYLSDKSCKCGENRIATLQFHHLKDKKFHISEAASRGLSITKILDEISKCEILCANCHAILTCEQRNFYKGK